MKRRIAHLGVTLLTVLFLSTACDTPLEILPREDGDTPSDGDITQDGDVGPDGDFLPDGDENPDGDALSDGDTETATDGDALDGDIEDDTSDGDNSDGDDLDGDAEVEGEVPDGDIDESEPDGDEDGDTETPDGDIDPDTDEEPDGDMDEEEDTTPECVSDSDCPPSTCRPAAISACILIYSRCIEGACITEESSLDSSNCDETSGHCVPFLETRCVEEDGYCSHYLVGCDSGYIRSGYPGELGCPGGRSALCCLPQIPGCIRKGNLLLPPDVCCPPLTAAEIAEVDPVSRECLYGDSIAQLCLDIGDEFCEVNFGENVCNSADCPPVPARCEADLDCVQLAWTVDCLGHWDCTEGECRESCGDPCGNTVCEPHEGENARTCPDDCLKLPCLGNGDCHREFFCAKISCDDAEEGFCAPRPLSCPEIWAPVCGCDGQTYGNECEATSSGVNVASEGECPPLSCWGHRDCSKSEYCHLDVCAAETGHCLPRPTVCPLGLIPVCGCDGVTYDSACEAHAQGENVDFNGPCPSCEDHETCGKSEYCDKDTCTADRGRCLPLPVACLPDRDPVCGCNNVTYTNACEAHLNRENVDYPGTCGGE